MKRISLAALALVAACSTSPDPVTLPSDCPSGDRAHPAQEFSYAQ